MRKFLIILGAIVVMSAIVASSMSIAEARNSSTPVVTIDLPTQANSGHAPITMTVKVSNPGDAKINFTGMIWHGGQGWSGGDNPYTFTHGTEVYWLECDGSGCYHFWRGDVLPKSSAIFSLPTFTGSSVGTYLFASTTFILTGGGRVNQANRSITIVAISTPTATPSPTATATATPTKTLAINLEKVGSWRPGTIGKFHMTITTDQFLDWWLSSSCGLTFFTHAGKVNAGKTYDQTNDIWIPAWARRNCTVYLNGNYGGASLPTKQFSFVLD